jgi:hypothetical protein
VNCAVSSFSYLGARLRFQSWNPLSDLPEIGRFRRKCAVPHLLRMPRNLYFKTGQ